MTVSRASAALEITPRPDDASGTLERLSHLLGVSHAMLTRQGDATTTILAACGKAFGNAAQLLALQQRALCASHPLIVADIASGTDAACIRFYAGIKLIGAGGAVTLLSLYDSRPRSLGFADQLHAMANDFANRATIATLSTTLARHVAFTDHERRLFNRASATARIGVWQCNLRENNRLSWTDSIYDLFELPRGIPLERENTANFYTPDSRQRMEAARARAIAEGSNFAVDAEIITAKGNHRWMRLTGAVECEDGVAARIFGMKQDITEEKLLADRTRYLAEFDVMTGLANRSQFQERLDDLDGLRTGTPIEGLLLIDLDGFKQVNDTYGHAVGDECLKLAAQRLTETCRHAELVARIGGDEFAVLTSAAMPAFRVEALARSIVATIAQPMLLLGQTLTLGASVGVAHRLPGSAEDLFRHADTALYAAKAGGRKTSRTYRPLA